MATPLGTDVAGVGKEEIPTRKPASMETLMLDKGDQMLQSLKPIKNMSQHVCTFASYSHDMTRQIETHHYVTRVNQDFLQCAVYDTEDSSGRLIGLWVNPRMPEMAVKPELDNLAKTYGKFWCTWQTIRGDKLPMGTPALMMSPQAVALGHVRPDSVIKRDEKYSISSDALKSARIEIVKP